MKNSQRRRGGVFFVWLRRVTHPREHRAWLRHEAMVRHPAGKRIGRP